MMLKRDTYNDYTTCRDIIDGEGPIADHYHDGSIARRARATGPFERVKQALVARSGCANVASAILYWWEEPHEQTVRLSVRFNSRAWTGLS